MKRSWSGRRWVRGRVATGSLVAIGVRLFAIVALTSVAFTSVSLAGVVFVVCCFRCIPVRFLHDRRQLRPDKQILRVSLWIHHIQCALDRLRKMKRRTAGGAGGTFCAGLGLPVEFDTLAVVPRAYKGLVGRKASSHLQDSVNSARVSPVSPTGSRREMRLTDIIKGWEPARNGGRGVWKLGRLHLCRRIHLWLFPGTRLYRRRRRFWVRRCNLRIFFRDHRAIPWLSCSKSLLLEQTWASGTMLWALEHPKNIPE